MAPYPHLGVNEDQELIWLAIEFGDNWTQDSIDSALDTVHSGLQSTRAVFAIAV